MSRSYRCGRFGHMASDCLNTYATLTAVGTEESEADFCVDAKAESVGEMLP